MRGVCVCMGLGLCPLEKKRLSVTVSCHLALNFLSDPPSENDLRTEGCHRVMGSTRHRGQLANSNQMVAGMCVHISVCMCV